MVLQFSNIQQHSSLFKTMMNLQIALISVLALLQLAACWRGSQITATSTYAYVGAAEDPIDLYLTVAVQQASEKVLLTVNLAVYATAPKQAMRFTIIRDDVVNLAGTFFKTVESTHAGEFMPIVINYMDTPGAGTFVYTVYVYGDGTIGYGNSVRQFAAMVIESSYSASSASQTYLVSPPSTTLGLSTSVTTAITTDRVLLLLNMDCYNVTDQSDPLIEFNRGGGTTLPMKTNYAFASGISTSMGFMDTPGSATTLTYYAQITRSATSKTVIGAKSAKRSLTAIVVPNVQIVNAMFTSMLSYLNTYWASTTLSVTITPPSVSSKILLMFNADEIFMSTTTTTACITFYRGMTNLGDPNYGLQTLTSGVQFSRRSPMIMWLDEPSSVSSVTYTVYIRSTQGTEFQLGRGNLQTHFTAVIVSEGFTVPTMAPVRTPTAMPTLQPTKAPTAQPTAPISICTAGCTIMGSGSFAIAAGNTYGQYYLPRYFKISIQISGMTLSTANNVRRNVLDLVNVATGASLLAIDMIETPAIKVWYNGIATSANSANVVGSYSNTYTTLTVTVLDNRVVVGTSNDLPGVFQSFPINNNVDTADNIYGLYMSNTGTTSAGGTIQNIVVSGICTVAEYLCVFCVQPL